MNRFLYPARITRSLYPARITRSLYPARITRAGVILAALGLLALASVLGSAGAGRDTAARPQPLLNATTGEALTLEAVVLEIAWRRETARKLRRFD